MTAEIPEEPASPPCFAANADSSYMGYAGRESIALELGAYAAALQQAQAMAPASWHVLLGKQQAAIAALAKPDGSAEKRMLPGSSAAAVWEEAIRRLQAFLPRIGDDGLHRKLRVLLQESRATLAKLDGGT